LIMGADAVADSAAQRLQISKHDILDRESDNMAVRLALAETQIINETKKMLEEEGVSLDNLESDSKRVKRSKTVILVKNIPFNTELYEMKGLFAKYGSLGRVVLPPTKTIALVEFVHVNEAKSAFKALAYKKFKHVPLYLEWAPSSIFKTAPPQTTNPETIVPVETKEKQSEIPINKVKEAPIPSVVTPKVVVVKETPVEESKSDETTTLFVKNLNFTTTEDSLRKLFAKYGELRSVSIAKKKDMKNPGQHLSMGYGFVEFQNKDYATKAIKSLQGYVLDEHPLAMKFSGRNTSEESERKTTKNNASEGTKLVIRNIPFEASKKDVRDLFKSFGQIKSMRIPKKFDGKSRGFAFIDFLTKQEASNAFQSLKNTHLYGRHMVIEYAEEEKSVEELQQNNKRKFESQKK